MHSKISKFPTLHLSRIHMIEPSAVDWRVAKVLHYDMQCCAVLCFTVLCSAIKYSWIEYCVRLNSKIQSKFQPFIFSWHEWWGVWCYLVLWVSTMLSCAVSEYNALLCSLVSMDRSSEHCHSKQSKSIQGLHSQPLSFGGPFTRIWPSPFTQSPFNHSIRNPSSLRMGIWQVHSSIHPIRNPSSLKNGEIW